MAGWLIYTRGQSNAVANSRLRDEGCGAWLDHRLSVAQSGGTPTPVPQPSTPPPFAGSPSDRYCAELADAYQDLADPDVQSQLRNAGCGDWLENR